MRSSRAMNFDHVTLCIVEYTACGPREVDDAKSVRQTCSSAPLSTRIRAFRPLDASIANIQKEPSSGGVDWT